MLELEIFGKELDSLGFDFYAGVPCSSLKSLINYAVNNCHYVMAANEGDAVANCAGATLAGKRAVVLFQNSGLTNATSPLTSLNQIFKIPVLGFVSLRGEPGISDEPQHELMGQITPQLLELMNIPWEFLSDDIEHACGQLMRAEQYMENDESFFFIVRKGTFAKYELTEQINRAPQDKVLLEPHGQAELPKRLEVLEALTDWADDSTVLAATTGYTGRELFEVEDRMQNLYMVGSMGCVSSIALGLAIADPSKKVVAIDGDGALLMRMGALATNAHYAPPNMCHILIDNGMHESTGGQLTSSEHVAFANVAAACGYPRAAFLHSISELAKELAVWADEPRLTFLHLRTSPGVKPDLGRPSVTPHEVRMRFQRWLTQAQ